MFCGRLGIDHSLNQRVAGKPISSVQARARTFAYGIKPADRTLPIQVYLNSAAHIVCARAYGYVLFCDVDAHAKALFVDMWKMPFRFFGIFVCQVKAYIVQSVYLHFVVDGSCHDVSRCKRKSFVVFLHKLLSIRQSKHGPIATHGLGNEERRMCFGWIV